MTAAKLLSLTGYDNYYFDGWVGLMKLMELK